MTETVYGFGQDLNVFLTRSGNHAPDLVCLYALVGLFFFAISLGFTIRKQIKKRRFLLFATLLHVFVLLNPLFFMPYRESYQTVFLLLLVPLAFGEICWRRIFSPVDLALLNIPIWHWSLVYWAGVMNAA
jgi:hypothetical protein